LREHIARAAPRHEWITRSPLIIIKTPGSYELATKFIFLVSTLIASETPSVRRFINLFCFTKLRVVYAMSVDKSTGSRTPSIVLQRITLVIFAAVAAALVWWQQSNQVDSQPLQKFEPVPLAEGVSELDFGAAEAAWSDVIFDGRGFAIDAKTEIALSEVIALMSDEAFDSQMQRIAFLVEKQFGSDIAEQFAGLLPSLKKYKDIEQRWWEENGNKLPPAYAELFQLQDEILGAALAEKLFSDQRRLASVMLTGYQIQNDQSLTQAEKDQALLDLHGRFDVGGADE